jgi:hypothetical protein
MLLEKVGQATTDHSVRGALADRERRTSGRRRSETLTAQRATLMGAIEKDPTSATAVDRLAQLYRDKGDARRWSRCSSAT